MKTNKFLSYLFAGLLMLNTSYSQQRYNLEKKVSAYFNIGTDLHSSSIGEGIKINKNSYEFELSHEYRKLTILQNRQLFGNPYAIVYPIQTDTNYAINFFKFRGLHEEGLVRLRDNVTFYYGGGLNLQILTYNENKRVLDSIYSVYNYFSRKWEQYKGEPREISKSFLNHIELYGGPSIFFKVHGGGNISIRGIFDIGFPFNKKGLIYNFTLGLQVFPF